MNKIDNNAASDTDDQDQQSLPAQPSPAQPSPAQPKKRAPLDFEKEITRREVLSLTVRRLC